MFRSDPIPGIADRLGKGFPGFEPGQVGFRVRVVCE